MRIMDVIYGVGGIYSCSSKSVFPLLFLGVQLDEISWPIFLLGIVLKREASSHRM